MLGNIRLRQVEARVAAPSAVINVFNHRFDTVDLSAGNA